MEAVMVMANQATAVMENRMARDQVTLVPAPAPDRDRVLARGLDSGSETGSASPSSTGFSTGNGDSNMAGHSSTVNKVFAIHSLVARYYLFKMLPDHLVDVYQSYKKDTDSVASWLASTAKACGYSLSKPKGAGRLKGKARKEAQKQQKPNQQTSADYIIAIQDFIPLAEHIRASTKPVISVPISFTQTIDRVIRVRSSFSLKLAKQGTVLDAEADATHCFFVQVLEEVREILRPCMAAETQTSPAESRAEGPKNKFAALNVYEPSDKFLDAPDISRPQNVKGDNTIYEAQPLKSLVDALIAYYSMWCELEKIRARIASTWSDYRDGRVGLTTAALATNTGIDLARNCIDPLLPIFEDNGGAGVVGRMFSFLFAISQGFGPQDISDWGLDGGNEDVYEVADKTYLNAILLVKAVHACLTKQESLYEGGNLGTYRPESDRSSMTGRAKFNEDHIILEEFYSEAVGLLLISDDYLAKDECIRGLQEMCKTGVEHFYFIYATQILLDIHHILRSRVRDAFDTLMTQAEAMGDVIDRHFEFHENRGTDRWSDTVERALRLCHQEIKEVHEDPVFIYKENRAYSVRGPLPDEAEKHRVLLNSPVLCGLLLYRFRANVHSYGLAAAKAWASIPAAAHLYNALQQEGLVEGQWADMDAARSLLKDSNLFVGVPPDTRFGYYSRWELLLGRSATNFVKRRAPSGQDKTLDNPMSRSGRARGIVHDAPVSYLFQMRYCARSGQIDMLPEHIDDHITRHGYQQEFDEEGIMTLSRTDDAQKIKRRLQLKQRKKAAERAELAPDQVLTLLVLALETELPELSFPYMLMHHLSCTLLVSVKRSCNALMEYIYGLDYLANEYEPHTILAYILAVVAANKKEMGDLVVRSANKEGMGDLVLRSAAKPLNLMIKAGEGRTALQWLSEIDDVKVNPDVEEDKNESSNGSDAVV
ncbi:hypothetical protein NM208_g14631 [Fusarium decemcellulare]|uniref:Uncharacterized protein n=1 Tax=Fusarium decemcellulare TaxID=57161 RepID=A0ACC1RH73_9HYPO|nr:hypothetical protein NM208_g14631 [Fusarium decemcellulare]